MDIIFGRIVLRKFGCGGGGGGSSRLGLAANSGGGARWKD